MAPSRQIYHITSGGNLKGMLADGGLRAKTGLDRQDADYRSIAYTGIQDRRARVVVPCAVGGSLHDYVPFYFCPRSPMLYAIHKARVEGAPPQRAILHLRSSIDVIQGAGKSFAYTDGHAAMSLTEFTDDLGELDELVDWGVVNSKNWADTENDGDRKRRKQAEFLVHDFVEWELIEEIGVTDEKVRDRVLEILDESGCSHAPDVNVTTGWYYG